MKIISGFKDSEVWINGNSTLIAYGPNVPRCDPLRHILFLGCIFLSVCFLFYKDQNIVELYFLSSVVYTFHHVYIICNHYTCLFMLTIHMENKVEFGNNFYGWLFKNNFVWSAFDGQSHSSWNIDHKNVIWSQFFVYVDHWYGKLSWFVRMAIEKQFNAKCIWWSVHSNWNIDLKFVILSHFCLCWSLMWKVKLM